MFHLLSLLVSKDSSEDTRKTRRRTKKRIRYVVINNVRGLVVFSNSSSNNQLFRCCFPSRSMWISVHLFETSRSISLFDQRQKYSICLPSDENRLSSEHAEEKSRLRNAFFFQVEIDRSVFAMNRLFWKDFFSFNQNSWQHGKNRAFVCLFDHWNVSHVWNRWNLFSFSMTN